MEHPYLFFVKLFEMLGLGHFAHSYPHVIYSWVVIALLLLAGSIAAKNITMIPTKMQNFFEVVISNGVFNLVVEKDQAAEELSRVLKPGGRLLLADMVLVAPLPSERQSLIENWYQ